MERKIDQHDIVDILHKRLHYYKKDLRVIMNELEQIILENMREATLEEPSEVRLFFGLILGAKRVPEKIARDPRDYSEIVVPEHIRPYVKIKQTFRNKAKNL